MCTCECTRTDRAEGKDSEDAKVTFVFRFVFVSGSFASLKGQLETGSAGFVKESVTDYAPL